MNNSTYTLALRPKYPHSPRARIIVTLEDCQLADVDDPVELLRWAAEFLTGKEWSEVTLDDGVGCPVAFSCRQEVAKWYGIRIEVA